MYKATRSLVKTTVVTSVVLFFMARLAMYYGDLRPREVNWSPCMGEFTEPIDIVFSWVNHSDPMRLQSFLQFAPENKGINLNDSLGGNRYRDFNELRYSLRSISKYAPWVNHIYIITGGEVPSWLDTSNPKISVVPLDNFYYDLSHLPTFNSHSVELNMHLIPGLSEYFLYFCDDFTLGAPVSPTDFFYNCSVRSPKATNSYEDTTDGQYVFVNANQDPPQICKYRIKIEDNMNAYSVWNTQILLMKEPEVNTSTPLPCLCHAPYPYRRSVMERVVTRKEFHFKVNFTSAQKFRTEDDLNAHSLYSFYVRYLGPKEMAYSARFATPDWIFVQVTNDYRKARAELNAIEKERPKFFCLNDDLGEEPNPDVVQMVAAFYKKHFPTKSSFELYDIEEMDYDAMRTTKS